MNKTKSSPLLALTECSVMVALATVLSMVKLIDLPYGGSITVASMLPIVIAVYRHGGVYGIGVAAVNSLIQLLLGMNALSYATSWQAAVAIILLDYVAAFSVFALCAVFKGRIKSQPVAMMFGVLLASCLRFLCHTVTGCTVWAGVSIPSGAAVAYSLSYNSTYMIPETVILLLATAYVFSAIDLSAKVPRRIATEKMSKGAAYCALSAGAAILAALIADVVLVFSKLQNEDTGELYWAGLAEVNYPLITVVSVTAIVVAALLLIVASRISRKTEKD